MPKLTATDLEPIRFSIADTTIAAWAHEYMGLTIAGVNDSKGLKAVHDARMVVKNQRVEVEKRRKELKADALKWGQAVDAEARRLTSLMEPIETHLEQQEEAIAAEKERIRQKAEEEKRAATQARVDALLKVNCPIPFVIAGQMSQEQFTARLAEETEKHRLATEQAAAAEAERLRIQAEEDAKRKAEAEALAKERARLNQIRQEQEAAAAAERAKLEAERQALEAERRKQQEAEAERQRLADLERREKEAAERARLETEQRIKRETEAAQAKASAEEAERKRLESLRPDKEKLLAVADAVDAIEVPILEQAAKARRQASDLLSKTASAIREMAMKL